MPKLESSSPIELVAPAPAPVPAPAPAPAPEPAPAQVQAQEANKERAFEEFKKQFPLQGDKPSSAIRERFERLYKTRIPALPPMPVGIQESLEEDINDILEPSELVPAPVPEPPAPAPEPEQAPAAPEPTQAQQTNKERAFEEFKKQFKLKEGEIPSSALTARFERSYKNAVLPK
jgi:ribosomal protein L12E/L44/L45/RPP1/RPP2